VKNPLITPHMISRWRAGTEILMEMHSRNLDKHKVAGRLPYRLARSYQNAAFVEIADEKPKVAINYLLASFENMKLAWQELMELKPENSESITDSRYSLLIRGMVLDHQAQEEALNLFSAMRVHVQFPVFVTDFVELLSDIFEMKTETGVKIQPTKDYPHMAGMANALLIRDKERFAEEVQSSAESWLQYLKKDSGQTNSACDLGGLAFTRLARRLHWPDFSPDHFLIPDCMLDVEPDRSFGFILPKA